MCRTSGMHLGGKRCPVGSQLMETWFKANTGEEDAPRETPKHWLQSLVSRESMTRRQWACFLFGSLLLVLSLLFVPTRWRGPYYPISYSFLFTGQGSIDFGRLFVEWIFIALVTSGLFFSQAKRPSLKTKKEPDPLASAGPNSMKGRSYFKLEFPGAPPDMVAQLDDHERVTIWDNGTPLPTGLTRKTAEASGWQFKTATEDAITRHTGLENHKTYRVGKLWQRKFVIPIVVMLSILTIGIAYYVSRRIPRGLPTTEISKLAGLASITSYGKFEWNAYNGSDFVLSEVRVSISVFDEKGNALISSRVYRVPAYDFYPQQTKELSTEVGFTLGQGQTMQWSVDGAKGRPE